MSILIENPKTFHWAISTYGNLLATFVFIDQNEMDQWIKRNFIELEKQYPGLTYKSFKLDPVKIGDTVMVWGEGSELFKVERLYQYSAYSYGFGLDSGWIEPVYKCYHQS